ncbi:sensor histidine kinase [Nonomuraea longicatena]|uniref:Signal transduction histidine kinase subgroup 3 dimerisation and phosphoacceptor domain-containing protein n=1 Tax=Nonomuraea longicatena TaxID=83682 RepID=A0ABP4AXP7_9ACTN
MDDLEHARARTWLIVGLPLALGGVLPALMILRNVVHPLLPWWRLGVAAVALVVFTWLGVRVSRALVEGGPYPLREASVSGVLAAVAGGVGGAEPYGWGFVPLAWLAVASGGVRRWVAVVQAAGTAVFLIGSALFWVARGESTMTVFGLDWTAWVVVVVVIYAAMCAVLPPSTRLWLWIWQLARQAHEGREARARLAVAEERLRFSRDMHDIVGHQLSALAVKSALAVRLAEGDGDAAKAEMTEVRDLTRKALRELREAVRGYRELDLTAELHSVKSVLEAAGVRCELRLPGRDAAGDVVGDVAGDLAGAAAPVLAVVLREAVTNVLKHSEAGFCAITLRLGPEGTTLEVRNDGVARRQAADLGSGLAGLGERLAAVDGTLSARPAGDGEFHLRAVVPR